MQIENTKKGFTLIELLVVISIIALLLSILMPALTKVKTQALFVVGGNNVKQVGLAEMIFTTENDGNFTDAADCFGLSHHTVKNLKLPDVSEYRRCRWHNEEENNINRPDLTGQLWPYLENQDVVMCPLYKMLARTEGEVHYGHNSAVLMKPQYAFSQNAFLGRTHEFDDGRWKWCAEYVASKVSHVRNPARVFMFTEENFEAICKSNGYNFDWTGDTLNDTLLFPWWGVLEDDVIKTGYTSYPLDSAGSLHKSNRNTIEGKEKGVAHTVFADGHFGTIHPWETQKCSTPKIQMKDMPHELEH
jgi:prepilin-type N-terminal cleavage/methylation domain-containing protein